MKKHRKKTKEASVWEQPDTIRLKGLTEAAHDLETARQKKTYRESLSEAIQAEILIRLNQKKIA